MGTESPSLPSLPDLAIVAETVRLAEAAEAERNEQRPPAWRWYSCDEFDTSPRPTPARDALVDFLSGQPEAIVAALYAIYMVGENTHSAPAEAAKACRSAFESAVLPIHSVHAAADLAAKGPLADGLRRGLERLGLWLEAGPVGESHDAIPATI